MKVEFGRIVKLICKESACFCHHINFIISSSTDNSGLESDFSAFTWSTDESGIWENSKINMMTKTCAFLTCLVIKHITPRFQLSLIGFFINLAYILQRD